MDKLDFLRELQGDMTQTQFADVLGVTQSYLSRIYLGKREAGRDVIANLLRAFPDQKDQIVALFLLSDDDCEHQVMTDTEAAQ